LPGGGAINAVRAIRIFRIFRLVQKAKNLKILIDTLVYILPSLGNIGSMLFLMFFIYSALGMSLFGGLQQKGGEINELVNFESFWSSFMILMRCATGETWNYLMHECAEGIDGLNAKIVDK
jgi:hypothetical protein